LPADIHHQVYTFPKLSSSGYRIFMTTLKTALGFGTSDKARLRFHLLEVFYQSGWRGVRLAFPGVSRATLYRFKKAYEALGRRLNSLVPKSTRPPRTRSPGTALVLVSLIRKLRESYPRMGKSKLKLFIDEFCCRTGTETISEASIGRTIKRFHLFFASSGQGKRKRRKTKRQRIRLCPQAGKTRPGYLQVDGIKFFYLDKYYYFLTAVDIVSKQAWVRLIPRLNSYFAKEFLREVLETSYFRVHTIQTDNGSEFKRYFEKAVQEARIKHLFSYPKHPKTNGYVERINWTFQDEFLFSFEDLLLHPDDFNKELKDWMIYYNQKRPHQSLNYLTPYQYYQKEGLSQKY